jgi:hypothetical protein
MTEENYQLLVAGDQQQYLNRAPDGTVPKASLWVYRFYDQAATTFVPEPHEGLLHRLWGDVRRKVTAEGFDIESAAVGLYDLTRTVLAKTGAPQVFFVAHSMGGLVVRCMMQKFCGQDGRQPAKEIAAKLFTYGTPHGGIDFSLGALGWVQETFGPASSDIFAPEKMYGYLTPGRTFGDEPEKRTDWDPQYVDPSVFDPDDIFCLVGTDPKDYGLARTVVGPKSDGLVRIERAYVRNAHRAYVFKSHSGSYGEVNSEEGYQNLRRFLFGRWAVSVGFGGIRSHASQGPSSGKDHAPGGETVWQADMRLAIRGLPIVMSEQQAAHWCPIQLNEELARHVDTPDSPVPLVSTFLIDPSHVAELAEERGDRPPREVRDRMRYALTLRIFKLRQDDGGFRFADHLEQVADWADTLIVDVGPNEARTGLQAWVAWNSEVTGSPDDVDPITEGLPEARRTPIEFQQGEGTLSFRVELPASATALPILQPDAHLTIRVKDREAEQ